VLRGTLGRLAPAVAVSLLCTAAHSQERPPVEVPDLKLIQLPIQLPGTGCGVEGAACPPGIVLDLPAVPAIFDLLEGLGDDAGGLLLQQTAALSQAVSGLTGALAGKLTNTVLDLGLAEKAVSNGGSVVSAPLVVGTPGSQLSMFMVSGVTKLSHDGFSSSSVFGNGMTPAFDETDYGLTVGFRWDGSRYFDLDPNTVTFGVIANYTHTDIDIGTNAALAPFFDETGRADVDSFSAGVFGLVTDGRKYGLVTVTSTLGTPETDNFVMASQAEYDTLGFTASAVTGVLIPLGASTLDLRGGLTFITANGDDYTDSAGVRFSDAELEEFSGQVSARLFRVIKTESGAFRPFIQGGLSQRFHYSNEVDVEGVTFSFEDDDTTVFARAGVDFDIDRSLQAYVSVRGDANESLEAIAAQVGLTFKLD
jgi:hypothetical protein